MKMKQSKISWKYLVLIALVFGFVSCHMIIPSKRSQLGYQSYDYWQLDSIQLVKFNPRNLAARFQLSKKKTYIVFYRIIVAVELYALEIV